MTAFLYWTKDSIKWLWQTLYYFLYIMSNNPEMYMKSVLFSAILFAFGTVSFAQKGDYVFIMETKEQVPVMTVTTTKTFGCSNFGIYLRQGWSRDTLTVNILGIDSRRNCNNVPDKARETIEIYGIREEEFTLRIISEQRVNFFHVEFDGESFSVAPELSDFIRSISY